jgi:hypothetical protein
MNAVTQSVRSTILHCRSKDATDLTGGLYNTNFRVSVINPILCSLEEELHISIMSCEIPYSFYNISAELFNNTLVYNGNVTLTFTNQDYSIDNLIEYFNQDTAFSAIFTTTYNWQKNKITFTNITNTDQIINFSQSTINKVIGFSENAIDTTLGASETITSTGVCNLATVHSIMVKCSVGQGNVISTRAGNSETLQKISVDVNSNGIIYLNMSDFRQISISQSPVVDTMEFRFTDQNDNLLQLNNCSFEFSMLFETFPRYVRNANRRTLIQNQQPRTGIPSQPMSIIREESGIDDSHPFSNTTEIEHKGNRLVLDHLIEQMDD